MFGLRLRSSLATNLSRAWCHAIVAASGIRATVGLENLEICERRECSSASQRYARSVDFKRCTEERS